MGQKMTEKEKADLGMESEEWQFQNTLMLFPTFFEVLLSVYCVL